LTEPKPARFPQLSTFLRRKSVSQTAPVLLFALFVLVMLCILPVYGNHVQRYRVGELQTTLVRVKGLIWTKLVRLSVHLQRPILEVSVSNLCVVVQ
jgi:hypothetical protein